MRLFGASRERVRIAGVVGPGLRRRDLAIDGNRWRNSTMTADIVLLVVVLLVVVQQQVSQVQVASVLG